MDERKMNKSLYTFRLNFIYHVGNYIYYSIYLQNLATKNYLFLMLREETKRYTKKQKLKSRYFKYVVLFNEKKAISAHINCIIVMNASEYILIFFFFNYLIFLHFVCCKC